MYTVFIYKHTCNSINETIILPFSVCVCVCACVRACVRVCVCVTACFKYTFSCSNSPNGITYTYLPVVVYP